jgi:hypothetical protein
MHKLHNLRFPVTSTIEKAIIECRNYMNLSAFDISPWKKKLQKLNITNCITVDYFKFCFVWLFIATWAIFQLSGGCHHYRWQGCKDLHVCSALIAFTSEGSFYVLYLLQHGTSVSNDQPPRHTVGFEPATWGSPDLYAAAITTVGNVNSSLLFQNSLAWRRNTNLLIIRTVSKGATLIIYAILLLKVYTSPVSSVLYSSLVWRQRTTIVSRDMTPLQGAGVNPVFMSILCNNTLVS